MEVYDKEIPKFCRPYDKLTSGTCFGIWTFYVRRNCKQLTNWSNFVCFVFIGFVNICIVFFLNKIDLKMWHC